MSTALTPYRSQSDRMAVPLPKRTGLIIAPKRIKPHQCCPPGFFHRLFLALTGNAIRLRSVWRCPECLSIKELDIRHASIFASWGHAVMSDWIQLGGEE